MDKENRRNSILKPAMNPIHQPSLFEYEEERTETFMSSRRKSLKKRVSFAGRDEIKEFQKHEVVTYQKMEKAFNQHSNETQLSNIGDTTNRDSEKENIDQQTLVLKEISIEQDYMEITSIASAEWNTSKSTVQEVEFRNSLSEECDRMDITSVGSIVCNKDESTMQEVEMEVCAYSLVQIPDGTAIEENPTAEQLTLLKMQPMVVKDYFCCGKYPIDISTQHVDMQVVQECRNVSRTSEIGKASPSTEDHEIKLEIKEDVKTSCSSGILKPIMTETGIRSTELIWSNACIIQRCHFMEEPFHEKASFCSDESNEFLVLAKQFNWKVTYFESVVVFTKIHNYLTLKVKLDNEYTEKKVKHYIVEDIEIDTRKDVEQKWTRFGLMILENSLENSNLREVCGNTQDLAKLMNVVEEHCRMFIDFATEDSLKFEMLANPRSIKFDADYCNLYLTFESSNLENLSWVRICLNLIPRFPLSAKDILIESVLGVVNKTEITNMISNIRPSPLYLTRVAACVEDFLKFRSANNERELLNCAKN